MALKVTKGELDGLLTIEPPTLFTDFRGSYTELYNERLYNEAGITQRFIQDDVSVSTKHVLRGIHGDSSTWKLVSCLFGSFYLVVVNFDERSKDYKKWQGFSLSPENRQQILIPPKFGNGHVVTSEFAAFHYKQTTEYDRASQFTLMWNDPELDIVWPVKKPILSLRDGGN